MLSEQLLQAAVTMTASVETFTILLHGLTSSCPHFTIMCLCFYFAHTLLQHFVQCGFVTKHLIIKKLWHISQTELQTYHQLSIGSAALKNHANCN